MTALVISAHSARSESTSTHVRTTYKGIYSAFQPMHTAQLTHTDTYAFIMLTRTKTILFYAKSWLKDRKAGAEDAAGVPVHEAKTSPIVDICPCRTSFRAPARSRRKHLQILVFRKYLYTYRIRRTRGV